MNYRVIIPGYFPTFFYRKRDAVAYQAEHGGTVQRKMCGKWYSYE